MKKILPQEIHKAKQTGRKVVIGDSKAPVKKGAQDKAPKIEQSLAELNGYVKKIVTKKDNTSVFILKSTEAITEAISRVADQIDKIQIPKQVEKWEIGVERDENKLIKTLNMKARG